MGCTLQESSRNTGEKRSHYHYQGISDTETVKLLVQQQCFQCWDVDSSASHARQTASCPSPLSLSDRGLSPEPGCLPGCLYNPVPGEETVSDGGRCPNAQETSEHYNLNPCSPHY